MEDIIKQQKEDFKELLPDNFNYKGCNKKTMQNWHESSIKQILEALIERENKTLVNTPEEVAELNKDIPNTLQTQEYNKAIAYWEAKTDTISYLKQQISMLNT